jgi:hypothetical protein
LEVTDWLLLKTRSKLNCAATKSEGMIVGRRALLVKFIS